LVVLIKVTGGSSGGVKGEQGPLELTIPRNVEPDGLLIECVPVSVEALE
jgi:hypothetical protein